MKISIIMPAFNVGNCIGRAIDSALSQTLAPGEIIVVDDASTDDTAAVVESIAERESAVKLIRHNTNRGPGVARNTAIAAAQGEWISVLDADDRFLPGRLKFLIDAAEARSDLTLVADNIYTYDEHAEKITGIGIDTALIGECLRLDSRDFVRGGMTNQDGAVDFGLLKPLVKRSFLEATGVRYPESFHGEDFIFYLRVLLAGALLGVFPKAYYLYTERKGSLSGTLSGLSRTVANYEAIEAESRELARDPAILEDPKLAELLLLRADSQRIQHRTIQFRTSLARRRYFPILKQMIVDPDTRKVVLRAFQRKFKKRRPLYAHIDTPRRATEL